MVRRALTILPWLLLRVALPLFVAVVLLVLALSWRPVIAAINPPAPASFPPEQVARGAVLAGLGDCAGCHGPSLSGGEPLRTGFGTLYSNNITPDIKTGIGSWSLAAFKRAMRDGVSRNGAQLYPALPYEISPMSTTRTWPHSTRF